MLVELRPDIDWDKGTTLAWIRDRIDPYAFPCCRSTSATTSPTKMLSTQSDLTASGLLCDTTRMATARRLPVSLCRVQSLREFVRRGSIGWRTNIRRLSEAWDFTFEGYDQQSEKLRESLCTVGNGYFATRGAAPESKADQVHYPGTYAAGVYNRLIDDVSGAAIDNESLVNLPNWLALTFRLTAAAGSISMRSGCCPTGRPSTFAARY